MLIIWNSHKASRDAQNALAGHMWPAARVFEAIVFIAGVFGSDDFVSSTGLEFMFLIIPFILKITWNVRMKRGIYFMNLNVNYMRL